MKREIIGICMMFLIAPTIQAAETGMSRHGFGELQNDTTVARPEQETELRNAERPNFRYSIIGGPGYAPDYGLILT